MKNLIFINKPFGYKAKDEEIRLESAVAAFNRKLQLNPVGAAGEGVGSSDTVEIVSSPARGNLCDRLMLTIIKFFGKPNPVKPQLMRGTNNE